jgi:hypothetical protein
VTELARSLYELANIHPYKEDAEGNAGEDEDEEDEDDEEDEEDVEEDEDGDGDGDEDDEDEDDEEIYAKAEQSKEETISEGLTGKLFCLQILPFFFPCSTVESFCYCSASLLL